MFITKFARIAAPLALAATAACSDSTSPGGSSISASDRVALTTLLAKPEVMQAMLGASEAGSAGAGMMPFAAVTLRSLGSFTVAAPSAQLNTASGAKLNLIPSPRFAVVSSAGSYHAFGGQFILSVKISQSVTESLVWTGIIGVDDLTNPTSFISAGVVDDGTTTAPTSVASTAIGTSGARTVFASFVKFNGQTATGYTGTTGQVGISSTSFSGSTACPGATANPFITACNYTSGTVAGSFNFSATQIGGGNTVTVPATTVSVPATRLTMSFNSLQ